MTELSASSTAKELREFRADLKALGKQWPRELTKVYRVIARTAADRSRRRAEAAGGMAARAAPAIVGKASPAAATVAVKRSDAVPMANVAYWGEKRHTGWYADPKYDGGPPQGPEWVGSDWEAGKAGEGPHVINDELAEYLPEMAEEVGRGFDDLTRRAFPLGR